MATSYDKIFPRFLRKIEDKDLSKLEDEELQEELIDILESAMAYIEMNNVSIKGNSLERDNETQEFLEDLSSTEQEIISMYMVVAWYEPKINSLETTLMIVGSREERWTSQKEHMNTLITARDYWLSEASKYVLKYGMRNNSYVKRNG